MCLFRLKYESLLTEIVSPHSGSWGKQAEAKIYVCASDGRFRITALWSFKTFVNQLTFRKMLDWQAIWPIRTRILCATAAICHLAWQLRPVSIEIHVKSDRVAQINVGVGAIPVWTWLPVLCCAMIWILLYRGYRYIFMDFIRWTEKDFFPHGRYCVIRERERCPAWSDINRIQNGIVFAPNTRSAFQNCTQTGLQ